ncbi:MAG: hypothetical protein ACRCWR_04540, partial [Saezia sp.]
QRAIGLNAKVVGINNRDLRDLSINLERTQTLAPLLPAETIIISESGIYTHQDVKALRPHANGYLIGSALMAKESLELAVRQVILGANKVCGLTRAEDAVAAYDAGAVYGGLIFAPHSARVISESDAKNIVQAASLQWVGVFVDDNISNITHLAKQLNLFAVQLHGQEDQQFIEELHVLFKKEGLTTQIWKALSIQDHLPVMDMPWVDLYVLDHGSGGTGKSFDWRLLDKASLGKSIIAGGVHINNVQQALNFNAHGLDLNSGVESSPGIKNKAKITEIFAMIRNNS